MLTTQDSLFISHYVAQAGLELIVLSQLLCTEIKDISHNAWQT